MELTLELHPLSLQEQLKITAEKKLSLSSFFQGVAIQIQIRIRGRVNCRNPLLL